MKIGVLTYWNSADNYGQQLQCFALQTFLKKLGHSPFLIRYLGRPTEPARFKVTKVFQYLLNLPTYFKLFVKTRAEKKYSATADNSLRRFKEFRNEFLSQSENTYSFDELMSHPPEADAYIAGSDQIWGSDETYYLPFVNAGKKKISYAPSFGASPKFNADEARRLRLLLNDFDLLTVRESSGEKALKEIGLNNPRTVVDPTMLIDSATYKSTFHLSDRPKQGVFIYMLGNETKCSPAQIVGYVNKINKPFTYVASQGQVDKYPKTYPTIPEWLDGILNSELVITNSFHCVVMALTFERPFVFLPLGGKYSRMNDRLTDLLGKVGLTSQIHNGSFDSIPKDIDFSGFRKFAETERALSEKLLQDVLR